MIKYELFFNLLQMLRGMVVENFVHFKERCKFDFSRTENGPNIFVGPSSTGKTAALELMRRCMDSKINSSLTKRFDKNENAYAFCEFKVDTPCYGSTVITGMIVEGKHESNPDSIPEDEEYEDWNEMQTKNDTRFHKVIMYCYKEEIKFCSKTYLEKENGKIVDLRMNLKLPPSLLKEILDPKTEVNDISVGIIERFTLPFVQTVVKKIEELNENETVNSKPKLWKMMEENFVGIFPMRGPGTFQWTKSKYIDYTFKSINYEGLCTHAEIITDLLDSELIDNEKEERIFGFLTYPNKFVFEKETSPTGKTVVNVQHNNGPKFPLLKTSLGIVEAKQFSLLMTHKLFKTICLEEPDRGMHPHMIERMKEVLHDASKTKTVIVATHSPYLLDSRSLENTFVFLKKEINSFVKSIGALDKCGIIRKMIEIEDFKRLLFSSHVLFVEGKSDKIVLQSIFRHIFLSKMKISDATTDMLSYEIILMGGKDSRDTLADFCKEINIRHCFVLDRDTYVKKKKKAEKGALEIAEYPDIIKMGCTLEAFPESSEFKNLSNRLASDKKTFIWKRGGIEDFLLDDGSDDAYTKIKDILGKEKLDATDKKTKNKKIKSVLNDGLSMKQSEDLANFIVNFTETERLKTFLEEQIDFFKE